MLNKHKVIKELQATVPKISFSTTSELACAEHVWKLLINHVEIAETVKNISSDWILPVWHENLSTNFKIEVHNPPYRVLAVDGSQIYPDRHQGIACYLINIGIAQLNYSDSESSVFFDSIPYLFSDSSEFELTPDIVNCRRSELEFKVGLERAVQEKKENKASPFLFLCDGSLIFWHLENKEQALKEYFLTSYISLLDQFYSQNLLIAGCISLPKSKELVNIIRASLSKKIVEYSESIAIEHIVDSDILSQFLKPFSRCAIFSHHSPVVSYYPEHLKPFFTYIDVGQEIVRIEFPAWIARNKDSLTTILQIIIDQCIKGRGYPVALSESHEQAVVKSADREFFYHMLQKISLTNSQHFKISQKSLKKHLIGI